MSEPDYMFADGLIRALIRAGALVGPDEAAGLDKVAGEEEPQPDEPVAIPRGCVAYRVPGRKERIVPQMYVQGQKVTLGHYEYTQAGAALAAHVRAVAVATKEAGGDRVAVLEAAREARYGGRI